MARNGAPRPFFCSPEPITEHLWIVDAAQKNVTVNILRAMLDRARQETQKSP
jgi:hypothetical protein